MPDRIDRRSFLARGAVAGAGVAAAGASGGLLAACSSGSGAAGSPASGPPATGSPRATPKKGGALIFGVEAEEKGFDPPRARFDETGILYARTVFDPLTIIASDGSVQPYLAQSITPNADYTVWTITMRPNLVSTTDALRRRRRRREPQPLQERPARPGLHRRRAASPSPAPTRSP